MFTFLLSEVFNLSKLLFSKEEFSDLTALIWVSKSASNTISSSSFFNSFSASSSNFFNSISSSSLFAFNFFNSINKSFSSFSVISNSFKNSLTDLSSFSSSGVSFDCKIFFLTNSKSSPNNSRKSFSFSFNFLVILSRDKLLNFSSFNLVISFLSS